MYRYQLYESKFKFYVIKENTVKKEFNILKINKSASAELELEGSLSTVFTAEEIKETLVQLAAGNKQNGGLKLAIKEFFGIFGFVSFTEGFFMILITRKSPVALIGGHYVFHIDDTVTCSLSDSVGSFTSSLQSLSSLTAAIASSISSSLGGQSASPSLIEQRYMQIFSHMDTTKNFYFSYSYDISRTLQYNLTTPANQSTNNSMFVWNHFLLNGHFDPKSDWYIPAIYGFVDQSKISVYGHNLLVTLIARRSRFFAGARFLKRGVSDQGFVANDVESEQILNDASTTFFSLPVSKYSLNPGFTSFVQHRGSIPLFWSQEGLMAAKPLIEIDVIDPFYVAAAHHFNDLLNRYGSPLTILNLVKSKEKTKREGVLLEEFANCIGYLNQFLPPQHKMRYIAYDMARASKTNGEDVVGMLETIANRVLEECGFFHSGTRTASASSLPQNASRQQVKLQKGVLRTNCIDCLDRTNAAQFVMGKQALAHQLFALGVIPQPHAKYFAFDSEACDMFNGMYHDHGDTIALQYGGSHLVNTMETYRRVRGGSGDGFPSQGPGVSWISHSRDTIETIKRYYSNSFTDAEKQDAINLFLGVFKPVKRRSDHLAANSSPFANAVLSDGDTSQNSNSGATQTLTGTTPNERVELWDLPTDYYLHNRHPIHQEPVASYISWFSPAVFDGHENLNPEAASAKGQMFNMEDCGVEFTKDKFIQERIEGDLNGFEEYYTPDTFTSLDSLYAYRMISTKSNVSAFQARVNATSQKSLIIYNLNIGGVKQFFLKPTASAVDESPNRFATTLSEGNHASNELLSVTNGEEDPSSKYNSSHPTSDPSQKMFVPNVKQKEREEYHHYCNQFRPVEIDPITAHAREESSRSRKESAVSSSASIESLLEDHPDYKVFSSYVDMPENVIDTKSEHLYQSYVNTSLEMFVGFKNKHVDVGLAQAYHYYLENGVFPSKSQHVG